MLQNQGTGLQREEAVLRVPGQPPKNSLLKKLCVRERLFRLLSVTQDNQNVPLSSSQII